MPKYSPFFSFVHFYRNDAMKNGRSLTLDQAKSEAEPIWATMSEVRKLAFVEIAEERRVQMNTRSVTPASSNNKQTKTISSFQMKIRTCIGNYLANIADVVNYPFYFASVHQESLKRLPSEISLLRFTIAQGAETFLHFLLNPEISPGRFSLISGTMPKPMTVIPIEGTANSEKNLDEVLDAMYAFCSGVIFTHSRATESVIKCFGKLYEKRSPSSGEIVPLDGEELITMLWEQSKDGANANILHVHNVSSLMKELDHLACGFHKATAKGPVCTLWKPYQLAYTCSEVLAEAYGIKQTEGYHKNRRNWPAPGKFYSGKAQYEPWMYETPQCWNSQRASSASSEAAAASASSEAAASRSNAELQANWAKRPGSGWGK